MKIKFKGCVLSILGSAILAFGLYNVHSLSDVTEGGVLGMTLLLDRWFGISPSISGLVLNLVCYAFGWKMLGKMFIFYSAVSTAGFSLVYKICEQFPPALAPACMDQPLVAAIAGAVFVGVGSGRLCACRRGPQWR